jgi:adenine-specific DNA-methyltransferase
MDGKSLDITQELLQQLQALIPQAFSEGKLDTTQLKTLLGEDVFVQGERYGLNWAGKSEAYKVLQQQTTTTLLPNLDQSHEWDTAQHVFIEGENLEVLKLLQKSYFGEVKMIYIDPPYNTGNDSFIYPDKFSETKEEYLQRIGDKNDEGYMLRQGAFRPNRKESGQYHSNWLNMMLPRLYLARNLLSDDGVIFVSIDDNEQANLKLLMDEVFGAENSIGSIVWKNVTDNNPSNIATEHESVFVYARSKELLESVWKSKLSDIKDMLITVGNQLIDTYGEVDELQTKYTIWFRENKFQLGALDRYKYIDQGGVYTGSQSVHNPGKDGYRYDVIHPQTGKPCKPPLMGYRFPESTMKTLLDEGRILFGKDHEKIIELKVYAKDYVEKLSSVFELDGRLGAYDVRDLFPEHKTIFTNPKPVSLLRHFFSYVLSEKDLILDFFVGSGTTAQAVMELNEEDGGNRRYICVKLPEKTDENSEASKAGYTSIADITTARIQKVIAKIQAERATKTDLLTDEKTLPSLGFRKFTLAPSNFKLWRGDVIETEEDLMKQMQLFSKPQRENVTSLNMAWELLLKNKIELTDAVQVIALEDDLKIYHTSNNQIALVLDGYSDSVQKALLQLAPKQVFLLDSIFATHKNSDSLKTNAQLTCEDQGIAFKTI